MNDKELAPIQQRVMEFVRERFQPGYNHYNVTKLLGDASSRQYYRYFMDSGTSYVLAAYPEQFDPSSFTYKQIYDLLQEVEVPVPEIVDLDGELGIVLQEDLGNDSLQKVLRAAVDKQKTILLRNAIDHVVKIQTRGSRVFHSNCAGYHLAFDEPKLKWEFDFFRKHYLGNYRHLPADRFPGLDEEFTTIARELANYPRVLTHRDFHVRNMMLKNGILFVIDFQDARWGPPSYDLASLLKDSLELDPDAVGESIEYYLDAMRRRDWADLPAETFTEDRFLRQFHLMCVQRLLKALGTYGYQIIVR